MHNQVSFMERSKQYFSKRHFIVVLNDLGLMVTKSLTGDRYDHCNDSVAYESYGSSFSGIDSSIYILSLFDINILAKCVIF